MDLIFVDVEATELLLLPFSGDGERARDELVKQSSHHVLQDFRKSKAAREKEREAEVIGSRLNNQYSKMGEKRTLAIFLFISFYFIFHPLLFLIPQLYFTYPSMKQNS